MSFAFSVTAIQSSLSSSIEPCVQGGAGWKVMGKNGTESGRGERDTVCCCHRGCERVCIRKMGRAGGVTKAWRKWAVRICVCVCVWSDETGVSPLALPNREALHTHPTVWHSEVSTSFFASLFSFSPPFLAFIMHC